jgi:hypothetical protein
VNVAIETAANLPGDRAKSGEGTAMTDTSAP